MTGALLLAERFAGGMRIRQLLEKLCLVAPDARLLTGSVDACVLAWVTVTVSLEPPLSCGVAIHDEVAVSEEPCSTIQLIHDSLRNRQVVTGHPSIVCEQHHLRGRDREGDLDRFGGQTPVTDGATDAGGRPGQTRHRVDPT